MLAEATNATSTRSDILAALKQASAATGADFNYLLDTATRESGLKCSAKASTSSACGLFQFVEQTWLGLIKQHGAQYGLGSYASQISQTSDGHYRVDNGTDRSAILSLRNNPQIASLMEGEYANQCRSTLQDALGRNVCDGELYAAHFLGTASATKLIRMNQSQPNTNAAAAFPEAADANQSVFYHANGTPKTVREVYDWAVKQLPGTKAAVESCDVHPAKPPQHYVLRDSFDSGYNDTLWQTCQLMNAGSSFGASPPSSSFSLTSSIIDVLASMSPANDARHAI